MRQTAPIARSLRAEASDRSQARTNLPVIESQAEPEGRARRLPRTKTKSQQPFRENEPPRACEKRVQNNGKGRAKIGKSCSMNLWKFLTHQGSGKGKLPPSPRTPSPTNKNAAACEFRSSWLHFKCLYGLLPGYIFKWLDTGSRQQLRTLLEK